MVDPGLVDTKTTILLKWEVKQVKNQERFLVHIHCRQCGERYTLKGRKRKGKIETGFRRCLCDNEYDFDIEHQKIY